MRTEDSALRLKFASYPSMGEALVEAAIMGYAVICYHEGRYCVVWWDGDIKRKHTLPWEEHHFYLTEEVKVA